MPSPRENHGTSVIGNLLFVFGGYGDLYFFNDFFSLNVSNLTWSFLKNSDKTPSPRYGVSFFNIGNSFYLFGGFLKSGEAANDWHRYSIET